MAEDISRIEGITVTVPEKEPTSLRELTFRRFLRHRLAVVSTVIFLLIVLSAVFAPVLAPYPPNKIDATAFDKPPSRAHILGTDQVGRDNFSRLLYGGRVSLAVGMVAVALYMVIGITLGSAAGYFGGSTDMVISRFIDVVLSFPTC